MRNLCLLAGLLIGAPALADSTGSSGDFFIVNVDGLRYRYDEPAGIRRLQSELHAQGAYSGPVDGSPNSGLHAAFGRFQQRETALQASATGSPHINRGELDRTTAGWLGLDFDDIIRHSQLLQRPDAAASTRHDLDRLIRRSYENSKSGVKIFAPNDEPPQKAR